LTKEEAVMKILKRILVILIILLIVGLVWFGGNLLRKHLIIQEIKNKLAEYQKSDNYYVRMKHEVENYQIEVYRKENIELGETLAYEGEDDEMNLEYGSLVAPSYAYHHLDTKTINYYAEGETRTAYLRAVDIFDESIVFKDYFKIEETWDYLKFLAKTGITSKEYNGKDCYCINVDKSYGIINSDLLHMEIPENWSFNFYYEKSTDLEIYNPFEDREYYEYKFDCVTEEDVTEPDTSDYNWVMYSYMTEEDYKKYNEGKLSLRICGCGYGSDGKVELTLRAYEQVPDESLEGEIGRFVGKNIHFSLRLDENMKCIVGKRESTIGEEIRSWLDNETFIVPGNEKVFPLLNDEFVFEDGKIVEIIFSMV